MHSNESACRKSGRLGLEQVFTQKPSPQQRREIISFGILSTVNPIGSMKTRGKSSCTLYMKEII